MTTPEAADAPDVALYLTVLVESGDVGARQKERLSEALERLPVQAVLLSTAHLDQDQIDLDALRQLVAHVQSFDCAAMVSNDPKLAQTTNADGCHVHWRPSITSDYEAARGLAGSALMVGADAGKSRHDAMVIAEAGADYIAFGVPADLKDQDTARARQTELLSWWAEVFEVPVVAFDIATAEQAKTALQTGADFIAATMPPNSADQSAFDTWLSAFSDVFSRK